MSCTNPLEQPILFHPYYKTVVWGGREIERLKGEKLGMERLGESWEISSIPGCESVVAGDSPLAGKRLSELVKEFGADLLGTGVVERYGMNFPLLVKLIDARDDLSIQVHPGDDDAASLGLPSGKTEMWYVIKSEPDAKITFGFARATYPDEVRRRISDGTLHDIVNIDRSNPGKIFYVPGGTIHALGSGNLVAEVQQTSDTTYRLYDYNRPDSDGNLRELHVEQALRVLDTTSVFPSHEGPYTVKSTTRRAVDCPHFKVDILHLGEGEHFSVDHHGLTFSALVATEDNLRIHTPGNDPVLCRQGTAALIPAALPAFSIEGTGKGLLIYC